MSVGREDRVPVYKTEKVPVYKRDRVHMRGECGGCMYCRTGTHARRAGWHTYQPADVALALPLDPGRALPPRALSSHAGGTWEAPGRVPLFATP